MDPSKKLLNELVREAVSEGVAESVEVDDVPRFSEADILIHSKINSDVASMAFIHDDCVSVFHNHAGNWFNFISMT